MNKHSKKHFRYFIVPFLIAVIFIAVISVGDLYNSGHFPESDRASVEKVIFGTDPVLDTAGSSANDTDDALTAAAAPDDINSPGVGGVSAGERNNAPHVDEPDYESDYYIVVFLKSQNVIVYGKGNSGGYDQVVKCFTCSSGKEGHSTRTGLYSIIRRYQWRLLVGDVYGQYSTGFSSSYLFHSVPYFVEGDPSSLDEAEYDKLGQPASKGCIRLCVRDTKWIYENCPDGTQVNIVDDSNGTQGEAIPPRLEGERYAGWDPSDPNPDSPYNSPVET